MISRRHFLEKSAIATAAVGLGLPYAALTKSSKTPKHCVVSCRDSYLAMAHKPSVWEAMNDLGAEGIELDVNPSMECRALGFDQKRYSAATPAAIKELQQDLAANNKGVTALFMANDFEASLDKQLEWTQKVVKLASTMKVNAIRIDLYAHKLQKPEFLPLAVKVGKEICAMAKGTPIRFAIENHGTITNDPEFLDRLFNEVGSKALGLTLDAGNLYWYGHPIERVYEICAKYASRVYHTHCKNIRYPDDKKNVQRAVGWEYEKYCCPIDEGDLDYKRLAEILRKAGYRGDWCLEDESVPIGHHRGKEAEVLRRQMQFLKALA